MTQVQPAYEAVVDALGTERMAEAVLRGAGRFAPIREIFAFERDAEGRPRRILSVGMDPDAGERAASYGSRVHPLDPVNRALPGSAAGTVALRVHRREIADRDYRAACYVRPDFEEKISLVRRTPRGWLVLSLFRAGEPELTPAGLARLGAFGRLVLPLVARHDELAPGERALSVEALEERLDGLAVRLTARERAVCAHALIGRTAEATALTLGLAPSSVITYRRRAYAKLGIGSIQQLAGRLL